MKGLIFVFFVGCFLWDLCGKWTNSWL